MSFVKQMKSLYSTHTPQFNKYCLEHGIKGSTQKWALHGFNIKKMRDAMNQTNSAQVKIDLCRCISIAQTMQTRCYSAHNFDSSEASCTFLAYVKDYMAAA